ncbi:RNA polymerase sigma factor SigJ [Paenibacillus ginsengarvi]|uniref:Sigma-70 family RNA polymerase sigma factor n=1 Tax=Paenibacillus ginsengarvi TaxID=400777 RepID=A0A3B0C8I1_9BACL|nr:RNA polymerase sigma factor SigJ [Paenibacillus ginsengarvi]RKN82223.1 sigma-70 family RNA polymerase sigma factor [Paenibacillus ginsengarvi]
MELESAYETYKRLMFSIAYRMLGSVAEAEDVVQDVFVTLHGPEPEEIRDMKAFLCRAVTNRCLNVLQSARHRKEVYPGPWLPEPLYDAGGTEPSRRLELAEEIKYAYLVLLERLSPVERAVYVLREAYAFEYEEIARMIGKSPDHCRKILSRARSKLNKTDADGSGKPADYDDKQQTAALRFIDALRRGSITDAVSLLSEQVVLVTDGGGKVPSALRPLAGIGRVGAFLGGIASKGVFDLGVLAASVNGETGMLLRRDGLPDAVWTFAVDSHTGQIVGIYAVNNPDKLHGNE